MQRPPDLGAIVKSRVVEQHHIANDSCVFSSFERNNHSIALVGDVYALMGAGEAALRFFPGLRVEVLIPGHIIAGSPAEKRVEIIRPVSADGQACCFNRCSKFEWNPEVWLRFHQGAFPDD